jgi:hypothetical protein
LKRVIVRFVVEDRTDGSAVTAESENVVIHPIDELRAKRELAGKKWVDDEVSLQYQTFLALRRTGRTAHGDFEQWLAGVAEFEPRLSHRDVDEALGAGAIDEQAAEALHRRIEELGDGEGESQAPPSL